MESKLYQLMNWPRIEDIVYSECDNPYEILGPVVESKGVLIRSFRPDAVEIWVKCTKTNKLYPMEKVDNNGFFAVLLPGKKIPQYTLMIEDIKGKKKEIQDSYRFSSVLQDDDIKAFDAGVLYDVYKVLGAHVMTVDGLEGVHFAVWAPNAVRVSVVGDFNNWDGRINQMQRLLNSGIFEMFIPEVHAGDFYKYEIKCKGGNLKLKADPYAYYAQQRPDTASIVYDLREYQWNDMDWMKKKDQNKTPYKEKPVAIYELHLGSFQKPEDGRDFYNYRELADRVSAYVIQMGYTHIELMPLNEYPLDESWGYQVTGYYAPTSRYGTPDDFKYFIDKMHQNDIGVIADWVPAHFPKDAFGLAEFDGTSLYEYADPKMQSHKEWGTLVFDYKRPQVCNFLMGSALFLVKEYHLDGIRMDAVASMLYRDYGRGPGEWSSNMYGGKENLEAEEFFKHMNSVFKKKSSSTMLIAEESTAWPMVTGLVEEGSLGFDYKWNMGWMNDFLNFMKYDPIYRKAHYNEMTFSMIYAYSENFILPLSHDEVVHGKGSMIEKMPGDSEALKFANLRATYGFQYMHPGKKLIFMGQDIAQHKEWCERTSVDWKLLEEEDHAQMQAYVSALNHFYISQPALYEQDYLSDGFEWINNISLNETVIVFVRRDKAGQELLVAVNFTPVIREQYKIGVTHPGKYKEIFNSDHLEYGGTGNVNNRVKKSEFSECDGRCDSIRITVPPLGIAVFHYIPFSEEEELKMQSMFAKKSHSRTAKK